MPGAARWGGGRQDDAQCFQLLTWHSNITLRYQHFMEYFCFPCFLFLGACDQHITRCHLHIDISPGHKGVMPFLFNPACSLLLPLSSTKLELCRHFLYQVTGSLLSSWPYAQKPVTKSHHSLWKDIYISRHSIECLNSQSFYRMIDSTRCP